MSPAAEPRERFPLLVLAGGSSRRMGRDKASLPWNGEPLLARVIARLSPVSSGIWVAAAPGQSLPAGPYRRVDDRRPGEGPLAGLAAGLAAIGGNEPVAVAACDYPFADPNLFSILRHAAPDAAVVIPLHEGRRHPLMALWRADAAAACERALADGRRRVIDALASLDTIDVPLEAHPDLDPALALLNVNDPAAAASARRLEREPGSSTRGRGATDGGGRGRRR